MKGIEEREEADNHLNIYDYATDPNDSPYRQPAEGNVRQPLRTVWNEC